MSDNLSLNAVSAGEPKISLAYLPPTPLQTQAAIAVATALLLGLAILPFAGMLTPTVAGFIPALDAIIFITDFITAGLLLSHASITRSKALWVLSCGYLFSSLVVAFHAWTFPGSFGVGQDIGFGPHTNFRVYLLWHLGLPVAILGYVWLKDQSYARTTRSIATEVAATFAFVIGLSALSCVAWLIIVPPLAPIEGRWLTAIMIVVCGGALAVLWAHRRSALDQWLMVVVLALIVELAITALIGGRGPLSATVGFYAGRTLSLVTSTVVLIAFLGDTTRLYMEEARANLLTQIVTATQALSSEIELPRLTAQLVTIALESTGADRILLVLPSGNDCVIAGEARLVGGRAAVTLPNEPISSLPCPASVIRHVIDVKRALIFADATQTAEASLFADDTYLKGHKPRSVYCLPLAHQDALSGILYLENKSEPRVFTPERVRLLEVLASQAAISLENATLYSDLKRGEAFLAQGQRISHTGAFGWNSATGEVYWSEELYDIFEYDRSTPMLVELGSDRMHPDDRDRVRQEVDAAARNGEGYEVEHRLLMPDGRVKYVLSTAQAVKVGNLNYVGCIRDITERVKAEMGQRQSQAELAHVARVATLNAMTASIGHEVSQPLSGILTNANTCARMLAADPPDLAGVAETVKRTIRDANRANEVIKRLRAMFSKKAPTMEMVDLNDVAREVLALATVELQRSQAYLKTELAPGLPLVHADRVQLQQVILNLLLNAGDAMIEVGDRPRSVLVETGMLQDGSVRLAVRDCGAGINPDSIDKLFEPFYTTKANGMGVGLPICRSIIESHGGRLWAEANDGPGATFSFCIPRAAPNIAAD